MRVLISSGEGSLAKTLTRWGHEVREARDGIEALRLLTEKQPCTLAILDAGMQGLRGAELCQRLRAAAAEPYVYVLLLMQKSREDDLLEAFEQGADDYLVKPFDGYELRAKLLVAQRILALQERLLSMRDELLVQATHDSLTGLWNRKASTDVLARELSRAEREHRTVGLMLADLDHFKQINDTYGHPAGDQVLQTVAGRIKSDLRAYDTVGRYGGEEFLIICPGCDEAALLRRGEHLRMAIARDSVIAAGADISVSLSLGAVVSDGSVLQAQMLKLADEALYRAKRGGRNRVELAEGAVCKTRPGTPAASPVLKRR